MRGHAALLRAIGALDDTRLDRAIEAALRGDYRAAEGIIRCAPTPRQVAGKHRRQVSHWARGNARPRSPVHRRHSNTR